MSEEYWNVIEKEDLHKMLIKLNSAPKDFCGEPMSDYCPGCKHKKYCTELNRKLNA